MYFQIIRPIEALRPYIYRYVFVRAEGSTDTMMPPADDPHFIEGKHVQQLLPGYGGFVFMRNVHVDFNGTATDELTIFGANQAPINIKTLSGWFEGMLLDFEPGGMHALLGIDMQQLSGKHFTATSYADERLIQLDRLFKSTSEPMTIAHAIDECLLGYMSDKEEINYARLRKVIAACDAAKGSITAAEMASVCCLGERQFLRVFRQYVGMSPKYFIRLRRFHCSLQTMQQTAAAHKPINLLAIALQHGYYDLSHMALEFQQMGCVSPGHFRMLGIPLTADFSIFFA